MGELTSGPSYVVHHVGARIGIAVTDCASTPSSNAKSAQRLEGTCFLLTTSQVENARPATHAFTTRGLLVMAAAGMEQACVGKRTNPHRVRVVEFSSLAASSLPLTQTSLKRLRKTG